MFILAHYPARCQIHDEHLINSYLLELNLVHFFGIKKFSFKRKPPFTVDEDVCRCSHYRKQYGGSSEN